MPRAHRHYVPGKIYHITHRCHEQAFLLKFLKDRRRYCYWLFEARKRYSLSILNYIVTSNHIHLLVKDTGNSVIEKSMQLVAGRVAQEFNRRKVRKGAFWEDRYHAKVIEHESHLTRCLVYIDLNMVRAGQVRHPSEWLTSGYHEIKNPKQRYRIIDTDALVGIFGFPNLQLFQAMHGDRISDSLNQDNLQREPFWTESGKSNLIPLDLIS